MPTPANLTFQIKNQAPSGVKKVYATITGKAIDSGYKIFLLKADGVTPFYPSNPASAVPVKITEPVAIDLGSPGQLTSVTIPHLDSARIYLSYDNPLNFFTVGLTEAALVEPSVVNASADPAKPPNANNYTTQWSFCEFAYTPIELFVNLSYVDFVGLPLALDLTTKSGNTQQVKGLKSSGLTDILTGLKNQTAQDHQPWSDLAVRSTTGSIARILSPEKAESLVDPNKPAVSFGQYYDTYVASVWKTFNANNKLTIQTQNQKWGDVTGYPASETSPFTFYNPNFVNGTWTFAKPTTDDVFSCSSGPFSTVNDITGNVSARLAAAFNRTTFLPNVQGYNSQPNGPAQSSYYVNNPTNHYSDIVHKNNIDHLGYGFPYDDVQGDGQAFLGGKVEATDPDKFVVTVGGSQWGL